MAVSHNGLKNGFCPWRRVCVLIDRQQQLAVVYTPRR